MGKVGELLYTAAEIHQLSTTLLTSSARLTADQRSDIEQIASSASRFSNVVTEMADFLESGSAEIRTLSFEVRTPITAIRGYADFLLMGLDGSLTESQEEQMRQIKQAGQKLQALVDALFYGAASWTAH